MPGPLSTILTTQLASLPDNPGIYLFYNNNKELIYVGKATSLKSRVRSYFAGQRTPRPIEEMIHEVAVLKFQTTDSVLEAIILEAITIKKFLPRYNVLGKDDKSWNYLVITNELFPRLRALRHHDLEQLRQSDPAALKHYSYLFGPYPGLNTKAALKLLRRLFCVSDCVPGRGRPCLYREIGQCRGVCTGETSAPEYRSRVILPLRLFLTGKKAEVVKELERAMAAESKAERFEAAAGLRNQLHALHRIEDMALIGKSFFEWGVDSTTKESLRIEGYDISNLGSSDKVGSMVVFDGSGPIKNEYRKFTIKSVAGQSDVDCLAEVIERRLRHPEWPLPQLFLIDGGRPQVARVKKILAEANISINVVGIAKGPERKRNDFILGTPTRQLVVWVRLHRELLIRVRDEAHRFAIAFNRSKRKIIK